MKKIYPGNWRRHIEEWLICEQYYFVLLWKESFASAQLYAAKMVERQVKSGLPTWLWRERGGDAAFLAKRYDEAHHLYEQSLKENVSNSNVLLKLSDVHFLFGELEKNRLIVKEFMEHCGGIEKIRAITT